MISIVVPARDEEETIRSTLLNLMRSLQDLLREIIVVDDHSSDMAREMVKKTICLPVFLPTMLPMP